MKPNFLLFRISLGIIMPPQSECESHNYFECIQYAKKTEIAGPTYGKTLEGFDVYRAIDRSYDDHVDHLYSLQQNCTHLCTFFVP